MSLCDFYLLLSLKTYLSYACLSLKTLETITLKYTLNLLLLKQIFLVVTSKETLYFKRQQIIGKVFANLVFLILKSNKY